MLCQVCCKPLWLYPMLMNSPPAVQCMVPLFERVVSGFALGLKLGATYDAFCDVIGIHPTTAEEFTTLTITRSSGASTEKAGC